MIFKMWVKSKFVFRQPGYYNLLTEKKDKNIHVFGVLICLRTYCYCQSQEILFKHHLQVIYFWEVSHCQIQLF